jgi:hypothetical protein
MRFPLFAVPVIVFLAGTFVFLAAPGRFQSFPLDDAWIHQVYARAFSAGHGFAYNDGQQEAGATSPLWVIATAPAHWFVSGTSRSVVTGVTMIGALCGLAAVLLFWSVVRRTTSSTAVACVAASLLALDPRLLFSSLSGMETTLLLTLWLGGLLTALKHQWFRSAVWFALMPVTRPESLTLLPLCAIALWISNREWSWRRKFVPLFVLGIPFAAWSVFCHATTQHWLPNTYYLKAHPFQLTGAGIAGAWQIVSGQGLGSLLIFPIGIVISVVVLIRRRRAVELAFLVGAPLIYMAAVSGTRSLVNEGYYWTRWLDPASLTLTAAFALGLALVLCGSMFPPAAMRRRRTITMAIGVIALMLSSPRLGRSFVERRNHLRSDSHSIDATNVRTGLWIRDNTPADAIVGVNDAGAIRYFGDRRTIDLIGINNQDLAFARVSVLDDLNRCDWLAIFPDWFRDDGAFIRKEFSLATVIRVPVNEYTICDCPGQTITAVFKKNR